MGYTIGTHTEERVCFGELLEGVEGKVGGYDQDTLFMHTKFSKDNE